MSKYEAGTAVAVVGLSGFQLIQLWNTNAPSLTELRNADPNDPEPKQRLYDADFMVGGMAVMLGTAFAVVSQDVLPLVLMLSVFGATSLWFHSVANGDNRHVRT